MAQMDRTRLTKRLLRLGITAAVFWVVYWGWIYSSKCFHAGNGTLWCPSGGDPTSTTLVRTSDVRMIALMLAPPVWALIVGALFWWALQGFQHKAREKKSGNSSGTKNTARGDAEPRS
jgi:hypothetical protein